MSVNYDRFLQAAKRLNEADIDGLQELMDAVADEGDRLSVREKLLLMTFIHDKLGSVAR